MKFTKAQLRRFDRVEKNIAELLDILQNVKIDNEGRVMFRSDDLIKIARGELCAIPVGRRVRSNKTGNNG